VRSLAARTGLAASPRRLALAFGSLLGALALIPYALTQTCIRFTVRDIAGKLVDGPVIEFSVWQMVKAVSDSTDARAAQVVR
jgi:hypothetical protein